jgi:hypothetical protein
MVLILDLSHRGGHPQGTAMPLNVQAYTESTIARGLVSPPGRLRDGLEATVELVVEDATVVALDEGNPQSAGALAIPIDDLLLVAADDDAGGPIHCAWHRIRLEGGPYEIEGELSTMPGFDPGRALTRPTGTFVLLRDVVVRLLGQPDAGELRHDHALVNRYTIDAVEADLMLGFFFPGARLVGEREALDAPLAAVTHAAEGEG